MNFDVAVVLMLLGHLLADFPLQGILANLKQKIWWEKQVPEVCGKELKDTKYKYDYIMGLLCHSLLWSILVCLPFYESEWLVIYIGLNTIVHAIIDDLKANRFVINLWQDQLLHLLQMGFTAYFIGKDLFV